MLTNWFDEPTADEVLPLDNQDRASQDRSSPNFQLPKQSSPQDLSIPEAPPPPTAVAAPEPVPQVAPQQPAPVQPQQPEYAPEVTQAFDQLNAPTVQPRYDHREIYAKHLQDQSQNAMRVLKGQGIQTEPTLDGSERIKRHPDGSPMFSEDATDPTQNSEGKWIKSARDDRGQWRDVGLVDSHQYALDPTTGEQYFRNRAGERVVIGVDQDVVEKRKAQAERQVLLQKRQALSEQQRAEALLVAEDAQKLAPLKEQLHQFGATPRVLEQQIKNLKAGFKDGAVPSGPVGEKFHELTGQLANWQVDNRGYRTLKEQHDEIQGNIDAHKTSMLERRRQALELLGDPTAASMLANTGTAPVARPSIPGTAPQPGQASAQPAEPLSSDPNEARRQMLRALPPEQRRAALDAEKAQKEKAPTTDNGVNPIQDFGARVLIENSIQIHRAIEGITRFIGMDGVADEAKDRVEGMKATAEGRFGDWVNPAKGNSIGAAVASGVGTVLSTVPAGVASTAALLAIPAEAPVAAAGVVVGMMAKAKTIAVGMIPIATQFAAAASAEAHDAAKAQGKSDDDATRDAGKAALGTLKALPAYMLGGAAAGAVEKAFLPQVISPFLRGVSHFLIHGTANVAASTALRSVEKGEFDAPTWKNSAADLAFAGQGAMLAAGHQAKFTKESTEASRAILAGVEPIYASNVRRSTDPSVSPKDQAESKGIAEIMRSNAVEFLKQIGQPADSVTLNDYHEQLNETRGKIETARMEGDTESEAQAQAEAVRLSGGFHKLSQSVISAAPEQFRKTIVKAIAPDIDFEANEKQLAESDVTHFATSEIGSDVRSLYLPPEREAAVQKFTQANGVPQKVANAIIDQHVGLQVVRDLRTVIDGGQIEKPKADALEQLGLLQTEEQPGGGTVMKVTDDALPLFSKGVRAKIRANPDAANISDTPGAPGDMLSLLVKAGQSRMTRDLGQAAESRQPAPAPVSAPAPVEGQPPQAAPAAPVEQVPTPSVNGAEPAAPTVTGGVPGIEPPSAPRPLPQRTAQDHDTYAEQVRVKDPELAAQTEQVVNGFLKRFGPVFGRFSSGSDAVGGGGASYNPDRGQLHVSANDMLRAVGITLRRAEKAGATRAEALEQARKKAESVLHEELIHFADTKVNSDSETGKMWEDLPDGIKEATQRIYTRDNPGAEDQGYGPVQWGREFKRMIVQGDDASELAEITLKELEAAPSASWAVKLKTMLMKIVGFLQSSDAKDARAQVSRILARIKEIEGGKTNEPNNQETVSQKPPTGSDVPQLRELPVVPTEQEAQNPKGDTGGIPGLTDQPISQKADDSLPTSQENNAPASGNGAGASELPNEQPAPKPTQGEAPANSANGESPVDAEARTDTPIGDDVAKASETTGGPDAVTPNITPENSEIPELPRALAEAIAASRAPNVIREHTLHHFGKAEADRAPDTFTDTQKELLEKGRKIAQNKGWDWNDVEESARKQLGLDENFLKGQDTETFKTLQEQRAKLAEIAKRSTAGDIPKPPAAPPKLRPGENQGDLMSTQREDFALVGESGKDNIEAAKAKAAKEKDAAELKAKRDREEPDMFSASPNEQAKLKAQFEVDKQAEQATAQEEAMRAEGYTPLLEAVRAMGGLPSLKHAYRGNYTGELRRVLDAITSTRASRKRGIMVKDVFSQNAKSPDEIARKLGFETPFELFSALENEITTEKPHWVRDEGGTKDDQSYGREAGWLEAGKARKDTGTEMFDFAPSVDPEAIADAPPRAKNVAKIFNRLSAKVAAGEKLTEGERTTFTAAEKELGQKYLFDATTEHPEISKAMEAEREQIRQGAARRLTAEPIKTQEDMFQAPEDKKGNGMLFAGKADDAEPDLPKPEMPPRSEPIKKPAELARDHEELAPDIAREYRANPGVDMAAVLKESRRQLAIAAKDFDAKAGERFVPFAGKSIRAALNERFGTPEPAMVNERAEQRAPGTGEGFIPGIEPSMENPMAEQRPEKTGKGFLPTEEPSMENPQSEPKPPKPAADPARLALDEMEAQEQGHKDRQAYTESVERMVQEHLDGKPQRQTKAETVAEKLARTDSLMSAENRLASKLGIEKKGEVSEQNKKLAEELAALPDPDKVQMSESARVVARTLKERGKQVLDDFTKLPEWNPVRRIVNKYGADLQRQAIESIATTEAIRKLAPDEVTRVGITNWIQSGGNEQKLRIYTNLSNDPKLKAGYESALNLTPEQKKLAESISDFFKEKEALGKQTGILQDTIDNYVTQMWVGDDGKPAVGLGNRFKQGFAFASPRQYRDFFEGEQHAQELRAKGEPSFKPLTKDIAAIVGIYSSEFHKVSAHRELVKNLEAEKAPDGRKYLALSPVFRVLSTLNPGENGDPARGAFRIDKEPDSKGFATSDHPALQNWHALMPKAVEGADGLGSDQFDLGDASKAEAGSHVLVMGNLMVHPDLASGLSNILGESQIRKYLNEPSTGVGAVAKDTARFLLKAQAFTKGMMFLGSPFHVVHVGKKQAGVGVDPFRMGDKIDPSDPMQSRALDHGLIVAGDSIAKQRFLDGVGGADWLKKIPVIGKIIHAVGEFTFHEYIPRMKMKTYAVLLQRKLSSYKADIASGKVSVDQLEWKTAYEVNNIFGHLNYKDLGKIGRNPTVQHMAGIMTLAPDFTEATLRGFADALTVHGGEARRGLFTLALGTFVAAKVLNMLLDENSDAHTDHPFSVVLGNREYSLRSPVTDIQHIFKDWWGYMNARISPLMRGVVEVGSRENWRGEKVSFTESARDILAQPIPMTLKGIPGIDKIGYTDAQSPIRGKEMFASALGFKIARYTPMSEVHKWADKFMESQGKQREDTAYKQSKFNPMKYALLDEKLDEAKEAYRSLYKTPEERDKVDKGFRSSLFHPVMADRKMREEFVRGLDTDQRKVYAAAMAERARTWKHFVQISGTSVQPPMQ